MVWYRKSLIFSHSLKGKVVWVAKTNWTLLAWALIEWWRWTWYSEEHIRQPPFCITSNTYSFRVAPYSATSTILISFKIQHFSFHATVHKIELIFLILFLLHNTASHEAAAIICRCKKQTTHYENISIYRREVYRFTARCSLHDTERYQRGAEKKTHISTLFIECRYDGVLSCLTEKHENCQNLILESYLRVLVLPLTSTRYSEGRLHVRHSPQA